MAAEGPPTVMRGVTTQPLPVLASYDDGFCASATGTPAVGVSPHQLPRYWETLSVASLLSDPGQSVRARASSWLLVCLQPSWKPISSCCFRASSVQCRARTT